jgi:predicted GIY-YIG superfamily endonuclease
MCNCTSENPLLRLLMAYYVYLLASDKYGTLYLGVTNDIVRRVYEHKSKVIAGFTKRYAVDKLVCSKFMTIPRRQLRVKRN